MRKLDFQFKFSTLKQRTVTSFLSDSLAQTEPLIRTLSLIIYQTV